MKINIMVRGLIVSASVSEAKRMTLRMIRLAARKQIWTYADKHWIVDFDSVIVTQRHRDARDNVVSTAQANAVIVNGATTVSECLAVFDSIAEFL